MHGDGRTFDPNRGYKDGTRTAWNKGLNKEISESVGLQAESRKVKRTELELRLDDDGKLRQRFALKKSNAKLANVGFELTLEEYCKLIDEAGLKSSQLGYSGEGYVLARYNDEGPYKLGNCRFITQTENIAEKKISDKMRKNGRNRGLATKALVAENPEWFSNRIKEGQANSLKMQERKRLAKIHEQDCRSRLDSRFSGEHNSQKGTIWVTDGHCNSKWRMTLGDIPNGFYKGRIIGLPSVHLMDRNA